MLGEKTWIYYEGIEDVYLVFCRMAELGVKGFGSLVVDASNPGLIVTARLVLMR